MTRARRVGVSLLTGVFLALAGLPGDLSAQASGEIQVLVAPLQAGPGVNQRFGERVADEVRKALEGFSGMRPVREGDVRRTLREFNLDPREMSPIQWRQLAGRMNVQLVMYGSAERTASGVLVQASFVDPQSGDELPVPTFSVASDGQSREAGARIAGELEQQVAYQRSVIFCAEYLGSDQLEDALRNCERALELNPSSGRALYLRGRILMEMEEWQRAGDDLERVVAESPANTDALQSLAFTHARLGNTQRSLELYREYLTFQPDDAQVRLNVAFNLAQAGAFEEATAILVEGVERDSTNAALWEYLGNVALAAGVSGASPVAESEATPVTDTASLRLAVRAFDKVLELKEEDVDPSILRNAIAANLELGDLDAALRFSERALAALRSAGPPTGDPLEEDPERPQVPGADDQTREQILATIHSLRADIFSRRNQFDRAVREMDRVLELDPASEGGRGYMKRGFLKLRAQNTTGAVADYRRAVEHGQDANSIANQLFGAGYNDYFQRGNYNTAIDMFKTALEFAQTAEMRNQINFFAAYGYYQWATAVDQRNEQREECQPAQQALSLFQNVLPFLGRSGSYQAQSQAQIREATDIQLFRQQQIIRARCRG